jgi:transposase
MIKAKTTEENGDATFTITPMTSKQLAGLYGISRKTLYRWLEPFANEIGEKLGRYYNNTQVKTIVQKLGFPDETIKG